MFKIREIEEESSNQKNLRHFEMIKELRDKNHHLELPQRMEVQRGGIDQ